MILTAYDSRVPACFANRTRWAGRLVTSVLAATFALLPSARADETRPHDDPKMRPAAPVTLNRKDIGYRGIWYMNQTTGNEFKYKYSGGLGTYCDYHQPLAVYRPEVERTFFCYGGTAPDSNRKLRHMVSYFDHKTKTVPRPTFLLDKQTDDAHDNPVLSVDADGYVWVFSASHGLGRPSYIHRSKRPYDIDEFEQLNPVRKEGASEVAIDNFSYPQFWHDPQHGFVSFFTRYSYPAARTSCFMTSPDGVRWSAWQRLAAIGAGHYQTSAICPGKYGTVMNYHPAGLGLNHRTNLYFLETTDGGQSWHAVDGAQLT
ncbi:MAG TPA: BNR-4 repeat-containing protein, partial [Lacipirellulaceae bacterium]|nr:BNR-4 repeat-containing protein [Lacipirellulaceae bacterium]